jgi:hypothetical protein
MAQIEERKTRAIEVLSIQFSKDALPVEEYERLVEYIHRVESERELVIVEKIIDETARYAGTEADLDPEDSRGGRRGDDVFRSTAFRVGGYRSPGEVSIRPAILSSRETAGDALRQEHSLFLSLLGTNVIDIQEGDLPPGQTVLDTVAILGETKILVPPGLTVSMRAVPIMGEARAGRGIEAQRLPGAPELVITGCALLGSIVVKVRKERRRR